MIGLKCCENVINSEAVKLIICRFFSLHAHSLQQINCIFLEINSSSRPVWLYCGEQEPEWRTHRLLCKTIFKKQTMPKEYVDEYEPLLIKPVKDSKRLKVGMCGVCSFKCNPCWFWSGCTTFWLFCSNRFVSVFFQFPNKSLLLAVFAACVGGTFQYGYNISVINSPTMVIITLYLQKTGWSVWDDSNIPVK